MVNPIFNRAPLPSVAPFTVPQGAAFLEVFEALRVYVQGEFVDSANVVLQEIGGQLTGYLDQMESQFTELGDELNGGYTSFTGDVNTLVQSINNRVGPLPTVTLNLTGDTVVSPGLDWTSEQPIRFIVNQDSVGGHTVFLSGIDGTPTIDASPSSTSYFTVINNEGVWTVDQLDTSTARTLDVSGSILRSTLDTLYKSQGEEVSFTVEHKIPSGVIPEHKVVLIKNGDKKRGLVNKRFASEESLPVVSNKVMTSIIEGSGDNLAVNASGFWETNRLMGLQIKDGVLIQDWDNTGGELGSGDAVVFTQDGELRIYDSTLTGSAIVADGGYNSFCWGHAAYRDGVITNFLSRPRYAIKSARTLVGSTYDGDLLIVTFAGLSGVWGATGGEVLTAINALNLPIKHLYFLDGGGSTQLLVDGQYHHRTTDTTPRPVPDVLSLKAIEASVFPAAWRGISERSNGAGSGGGISWCETEEYVFVRVSLVPVGAMASGAQIAISQLPENAPKPLYNANVSAYITGHIGQSFHARVGTGGDISVYIPPTVTSGNAVTFDAQYPKTRKFQI